MVSSVLDHTYGRDARADAAAAAVSAFPVLWAPDDHWRFLGGFPDSPPGADRARRLEAASEASRDAAARRVRGGDRSHRVVVSPGSVRLTFSQVGGWSRAGFDPDVHGPLLAEMRRVTDRLGLFDLYGPGRFDGTDDWFHDREALAARLEDLRAQLGVVAGPAGRAGCREWSRKSRARMTRRLASLDWSPMEPRCMGVVDEQGDELVSVPAMVTLTYPGDYLAVVPDGEVAKRHLRAFRAAYARRFPGHDAGCWKLESQRRGAPHFHLLLMVPVTASGYPSSAVRVWARLTWARIVGATGEERRRHEAAGVSVDTAEGARYSDPQRIAVYFSKHNAPGESSKAYQNEIPAGWLDESGAGTVGRFWGYWRLRPVEVEATISAFDAVDAARLLRGWVKAQGRTRRVRRRRTRQSDPAVWVVSRAGTVTPGRRARRRWVTERYDVRALGGTRPAGFVLANDGPGLAAAVGRAVSMLEGDQDWPPGQRRPLP